MSTLALTETTQDFMEPWRKKIESALDQGGNPHSVEDIVDAVENGTLLFWTAEDSCAVTEIVTYPNFRDFHVFLAAGTLEEIKDMYSSFETYAKELGCKVMSLSGRRGWKKGLSDLGFQEAHVTLAKEIY